MKILIINLSTETARMDFQRAQMAALDLEFERIEAITPATVVPALDDPHWNVWQRPLKDVEKALLSSHRQAWAQVVVEKKPCLILEDDAYLSARTPEFLQDVQNLKGIDHISLEVRSRKKLLADTPHPSLHITRLYQDRSGAAAYILWPNAANNVLSRPAALADAVLCSAYDLVAYQTVPALAIQLDQCESYHLVPPLKSLSALSNAPPVDRSYLSVTTRFSYRVRRIMAQLRMGLRHLRHSAHASKREIFVANDIGAHRP